MMVGRSTIRLLVVFSSFRVSSYVVQLIALTGVKFLNKLTGLSAMERRRVHSRKLQLNLLQTTFRALPTASSQDVAELLPV